MKKYFVVLILVNLYIVSCSPQRNITSASGNVVNIQDKPKSYEEMISKLNGRIDSLIEVMERRPSDARNVFDSTMNNGALGDVKYSVFPPNEFYKINGDCWRLLDSSSFVGTDLYRKTRSTGLSDRLPDGRGVFIRGMMFNKKDTITGDQEKNRTIGNYQKDQVKSHQHKITLYKKYGFHASESAGVAEDSKQNTVYDFWTTEDNIKNEGRPKNIALYIYIRINYLCN